MHRRTNPIVSIHLSNITVDSLRLINTVTGTEFPVSGDAPLRQAWERLETPEQKDKLNAACGKSWC